MKLILFVLLMSHLTVFSQGCAGINNNNVGAGGTHATICFFNSSGVSLGACLDCHMAGPTWKCGAAFNAYTNYYKATINGVPCFRAAVLPVELTYFVGNQDNNTVKLTWETASESLSDYYELYRLNEFSTLELIGRVEAGGNSSVKLQYELIDNLPLNGANLYVLKQYDIDGESEIFDPISIEFKEKEEIVFYPNPLNSNVIRWSHGSSVSSIQIYSTDGKMIAEVESTVGFYAFENVPQSLYIFKAIYKDQSETFYKIQAIQ